MSTETQTESRVTDGSHLSGPAIRVEFMDGKQILIVGEFTAIFRRPAWGGLGSGDDHLEITRLLPSGIAIKESFPVCNVRRVQEGDVQQLLKHRP